MTEPSSTPAPEISEYQLGESVGYLLARVKSTMSNMVTQRSMAELGITSQQGSILFMVASGKCVLAAELAREYGIDASAVTRLIDRLEKRGLLERQRSSEDRRQVHVRLTDRAMKETMKLYGPIAADGHSLLSAMTTAELETVNAFLDKTLALQQRHLERVRGDAGKKSQRKRS